jgi:hypothetical protein
VTRYSEDSNILSDFTEGGEFLARVTVSSVDLNILYPALES